MWLRAFTCNIKVSQSYLLLHLFRLKMCFEKTIFPKKMFSVLMRMGMMVIVMATMMSGSAASVAGRIVGVVEW